LRIINKGDSKKCKIVYSLRIYLELTKRGFYPIATTLNPKNNELICWIYERTPEFIETLDEVLAV
jgi:hypothetical protein